MHADVYGFHIALPYNVSSPCLYVNFCISDSWSVDANCDMWIAFMGTIKLFFNSYFKYLLYLVGQKMFLFFSFSFLF